MRSARFVVTAAALIAILNISQHVLAGQSAVSGARPLPALTFETHCDEADVIVEVDVQSVFPPTPVSQAAQSARPLPPPSENSWRNNPIVQQLQQRGGGGVTRPPDGALALLNGPPLIDVQLSVRRVLKGPDSVQSQKIVVSTTLTAGKRYILFLTSFIPPDTAATLPARDGLVRYALAYGDFSIYSIEGDRVTLGRFKPAASGVPQVNQSYYAQHDGARVDVIEAAIAARVKEQPNARSKADRYREAYKASEDSAGR